MSGLREGVELWLESIATQPDDELVRAGDVRDELMRLLRAGAESPWRPIVEAPDDGKRRVVLLPRPFKDSRVWVLRDSGSKLNGWTMPGVAGLFPTHFLDTPPLPAPPEVTP